MSTRRAAASGSAARAGRARAPLTRERILEAALDLVERDGADALSMRRLAGAVGVEAMSLYHHVDGKDAVLDGLTGLFFGRIEIPAPTDDWRVDVRALAQAFRAAARRYPQTASLALTREAMSDPGIAFTAAALDVLLRAGFDPDGAVAALRAVTALLVGTLLRELGPVGRGGRASATAVAAREAALRASEFASIQVAAEPLARFDVDREYDDALELILAALGAASPGAPSPRRAARRAR